MGIADVFDALINIRCYKSAWTIDEAITYIKDKSGTQFDPKVTEAFLKLYDQGLIEKLILESKAWESKIPLNSTFYSAKSRPHFVAKGPIFPSQTA